jgi:glutathione S-transferase
MARQLYDLAGADPNLRFSPYCWRACLALAHKGLEVETVPWRFTEKDVIAFSGQGLVPVLVDDETTVADSWAIATYLEERYPDCPSVFGGPGGMAPTRFVNAWADTVLNPEPRHRAPDRRRCVFRAE